MKKVAIAVAVAVALSVAVPALGSNAVQSANPLRVAKRALKIGKRADHKANLALSRLNRGGGELGEIQVARGHQTFGPGDINHLAIGCPAGTVIVSGGYTVIGSPVEVFYSTQSGNGWVVGVDNFFSTQNAELDVEAYCSTVVGVVAKASKRIDTRALDGAQKASH